MHVYIYIYIYIYFFFKLWDMPKKKTLPIPTSNAGRDWGQEEKGTTEDEMAGWHH